MARVVDILETDYAAILKKRHHPLLGHATISVGTISGGEQPNIVPDSCAISVDRRTLPGETERGVQREIGRFLRERKLNVIFANEKLDACSPLETDPRVPPQTTTARTKLRRKEKRIA
jgi:acetylornithine deacetylase/succinyl-diaminopimelate desuccinylase-like protein